MTALKLLLPLLICAIEAGFIDAAVPTGYTHIRSSAHKNYYKYHKEGAKWSDAVSTCRSEGARLFHPDSAEELQLVLRELDVDSGYNFFTGLSDLDKLGEYKTVDGRPISQVYIKWEPGQPYSGGSTYRCGVLHPSNHLLSVGLCDNTRPFICKHEEEVTATDVTTVAAANASYVASLEQQLANRTAALEIYKQEAASLKLQVANQSAAMELMKQEADFLKLQLVNRTAEMEAIQKMDAENQPSALLEKIVVAIGNQTAVIKLQDANQAAASDRLTAAVERQALAIEKLADPPEQ